MDFKEKLRHYAELLIVHGLNVQKGQVVNLAAEVIHREFIAMLAESAYKHGAKYVNIDLSDPFQSRIRILNSSEEDLKYVPRYVTIKYTDMVDEIGANLRLIGSEEPDILADLDTKRMNLLRMHQRLAVKYFYDEGIGKSKVHWTVAAASTPKWGRKVYPELNEAEAYMKLWEDILSICRVTGADCINRWKDHNRTLQTRGRWLSGLKIKELRFIGPNTDLVVGLSPKAVFIGGGDNSPRGVHFEPNVPTEECFTTPDWRKTEGKVQTTRPFLINGKLVKGLYAEFKAGEISYFRASEGEETFREYIKSDEGGRRLGEVALVGTDSPVFQTGRVFEEILFDENAACHIAVGSAYKFCLKGGAEMSETELKEIGCNESTVHTDMMISNEEVDVVATTYDGQKITLIRKGGWVNHG